MWISIVITVFLRVPIAYGLAYLTRSELYPTGRLRINFLFPTSFLDTGRCDHYYLLPKRKMAETQSCYLELAAIRSSANRSAALFVEI